MDQTNSQLGLSAVSNHQTDLSPQLQSRLSQLLPICRSDRWQVRARLQELDIMAECLESGGLAVEILSPTQVVQVRSVLQSLLAPRQTLVAWCDRCWHH